MDLLSSPLPSSPTSSMVGPGGRTPMQNTFFSSDNLASSDIGRAGDDISHSRTRGRPPANEDEEVPADEIRRAALAGLDGIPRVTDAVGEKVQEQFERFLQTFELHDERHQGTYHPYVDMIKGMQNYGLTTVFVDWEHLQSLAGDDTDGGALAAAIQSQFYRFLPFLQRALRNVIKRQAPALIYGISASQAAQAVSNRQHAVGVTEADSQTNDSQTQTAPSNSGASSTGSAIAFENEKVFQVGFYGLSLEHKIRDLRTERIGSLLKVCGTVTRTSEVRPELYRATFKCDMCQAEISGVQQASRYTEPYMCPNPTCGNRSAFTLIPSKSQFVDWQRVRVQENPGEIPTGSMPRTLDVIVRGDIVDRAKAGDKCVFTGTAIVIPDVSQLGLPGVKPQAFRDGRDQGRGEGMNGAVRGLKALGVRDLTYRIAFLANMVQDSDSTTRGGNEQEENAVDTLLGDTTHGQREYINNLTEQEIVELHDMVTTPQLFDKLVSSIAPTVWGHEIVKTGILLQLLGGVHKQTMEGIKLRGDINVCIVGDPSTSKSQFLKYVTGFMPRTVYTSGKASSAAGLTAAVVKDEETEEYTIEAGALMLADNGICAIDEFDKMDLRDQVAIHEAMEQQTISIAKAGIQATLNARTSILAAANPIGGRYNRKASLRANITMSAPIMSRFDLFFVVLDECNEQADSRLADHIVALHMDRDEAIEPPFSTEQLRRFIMWARTYRPVMTNEAKSYLVERYKELRNNDAQGSGRTSYRITVRQLESLIRLSEAIARAHCTDEIVPEYVRQAYNLLRLSIIYVVRDDVDVEGDMDEFDNGPSLSQRNESAEDVLGDAAARARRNNDESGLSEVERHTTKISYDKYMSMMRLFVQYIQTHARDTEAGVSLGELERYYLEENEDAINSEAQLNAERRLVRKVVKRLVKDNILLEFRGEIDALDNVLPDTPELQFTYVVHPNAIVGN